MAASSLSVRVARALLQIGAVTITPDAPFTWSSGLRAPLYCDIRLSLAHPSIRQMFAEAFAARIKAEALAPDIIVGVATGGIAHAAYLSQLLDLPMAYVRTLPKAHGHGHTIEGPVLEGQRVVVVEDLISTGMSSWGAAESLRSGGRAKVVALAAIFTYGFEGAQERFRAAGIRVLPLTDLDTLLSVAREQERILERDLVSLRAWRLDPRTWSKMRAR